MKKIKRTKKIVLFLLAILFIATPFLVSNTIAQTFITPPTCGAGDGCLPNCPGTPDPDCRVLCAEMPGSGGLIPCGKSVNDPDTSWNECAECNTCSMILMGQLIIEFLVKIAATVAVLVIVVGGLLYMFAAGNTGALDKAKFAIKASLFGFIVVFIAWAVVDSSLIMLGYIDPMSGDDWQHVSCELGTLSTVVPSDCVIDCVTVGSGPGCLQSLENGKNAFGKCCGTGFCYDCKDGFKWDGTSCNAACGDGVCDDALGECSFCIADCNMADCCGNGTCDTVMGENCSNCADCDCTNPQICCSGACQNPQCDNNNDCDDGDDCTENICSTTDPCTGICSNPFVACSMISDGCCSPSCNAINDIDCGGGPAVCTPDGCNTICPTGCTVADDPDCGCQGGNGCCGIGCNNANDGDCPLGCTDTCASEGYECGTRTICGELRNCGFCTLPAVCTFGGGCICPTKWICTAWSACVDGNQTRSCSDSNDCGTNVGKPAENQFCGATPVAFDWSHKVLPGAEPAPGDWMSPVKNQMDCGTCSVFAAAAVIEGKHNIESGNSSKDINLAEQDIVSACAPGHSCGCYELGCHPKVGTWDTIVYKHLIDYGMVEEACNPYIGIEGRITFCHERCASESPKWTLASHGWAYSGGYTVEKMKGAIVSKGPLSAAMVWRNKSVIDGMYECADDGAKLTHAVTLVGYNDSGGYWILKNSHGATAGPLGNGYFKLKYGECGIERYTPQYVVGVSGM